MKTKIAATAAALAMLAGGAIVTAPAAQAYTDRDYAFVRMVRADAPAFKYVTAKVMIKVAHLTCNMLDTGVDETEAAWMMVEEDFTQHQAVVFIASAITVYCDWHGGDELR